MSTRTEMAAECLRLRGAGLTYKQIAERLGKSYSTVNDLIYDPDGSKVKARKDGYRGVCVDCGGRTDGSNGRDKAPTRCLSCARGIEPPRVRLCVPVRLTEIPQEVRLEAVPVATRIYRDPVEQMEILLAAIAPSNTTYWVSESARPLIERWAA